jgi:hypothetical protein
MSGPVDEHADDLESTVYEGAEEETADFPETGDELDDEAFEGEDDEADPDEDPAEL